MGGFLSIKGISTCVKRTDTLDLARLDRERQGPLEAEYSYGEEVDLHRHYANCTKNPGHKNFIPVDKFSIEDLPERYRDNFMVDYIRAESDLTVLVTVKYVSDRRPETVGVSDKPYLNYPYRGQRRTSVGTGWVEEVYIDHEFYKGETCHCKDCRKSTTLQTNYAKIMIRTAAHVVYDTSEAEHTTCHLFFDRGGSPETCKGVIALTGMDCWVINIQLDYCEMIHYTHDLELAGRLKQRCQQRENMRRNIRDKLQETTNYVGRQPILDKQPLLIIVSHPHGCSKQISIGRWNSVVIGSHVSLSCTYTTPTCPGCSGAPVCLPQKSDTLDKVELLYSNFPTYPAHVGVFDKQCGVNLSHLFPG